LRSDEMQWTMDKRKKKAFEGSLRSSSRTPGRESRWPRRRRAARVTRGYRPPALLSVCPPVGELHIGCRVGHLPQVAAIGSRDRDEILVATTRRAQEKHDVLAIGRPFRPTHEEAAGVGCQHDLTLPAAIRVDERESPLVVAGQNPLPVW